MLTKIRKSPSSLEEEVSIFGLNTIEPHNMSCLTQTRNSFEMNLYTASSLVLSLLFTKTTYGDGFQHLSSILYEEPMDKTVFVRSLGSRLLCGQRGAIRFDV